MVLEVQEDRKDCFALKGKKCTVLLETECENCKFYKSKEQFVQERKKSKEERRKKGYLC